MSLSFFYQLHIYHFISTLSKQQPEIHIILFLFKSTNTLYTVVITELNKHRSSVISSSFPNIDTVNSMVTSSVRPGKNLSTNLLDGFLVNNKLTSSVPLTTSNDYSKQNNSIIMSSKNELTSGSSTVLNYNRGSLASQSGRWWFFYLQGAYVKFKIDSQRE